MPKNKPVFRHDPDKHIYEVDGVRWPSITEILEDTGIVVYPKGERYEEAKLRGKAVHKTIELEILGTLDETTVDDRLRPYLEAWREFLMMTGFAPRKSEMPLYHPGLRHAGRLDLVGHWSNSDPDGVVEIKTGTQVHPGTAIQTAAQAMLATANGYHVSSRRALLLTPKGKFFLTTYQDQRDYDVWTSAVTVSGFIRSHNGGKHGKK